VDAGAGLAGRPAMTAASRDIIGRVLRHPAMVAVKLAVRDAWWAWRGPRFTNPRVGGATRLMFVCQGNICRSPFAALLTARVANESGLAVECRSSGYRARAGATSPDDAIEAARALGIDLRPHRASPLDAEGVAWADVIVVMEIAQTRLVAEQLPAAIPKLFVLPLVDADGPAPRGFARFNIADPYGRPQDVFDACYARIGALVSPLVAALRRERDD
jgi:protein-tyrosine-phosphatase